MKMKGKMYFLLVLFLLSISSYSIADNWYAGLDSGYTVRKFSSNNSYTNGTNRKYSGDAYGCELGVFGGYKKELSDKILVGFQLRAGIDSAKFNMTLPDLSTMEKTSPYNYSFSILPEIKIMDKLSFFAELGIGENFVDEKKEPSSDAISRYDYSEWIVGYIYGAGLKYQVNEKMNVFVGYKYVDFESFSYKACNSSGQLLSTVSNSVDRELINAGISYSF